MARAAGKPVVLWGASANVEGASQAKLADLRAFDLITARDSLTIQFLAQVGISASVRHVADPAFAMAPMVTETGHFWPVGSGVLGLNVSPLLARFRHDGETAVVRWGSELVRTAIDVWGLGVLLIPHVTQPMAKEYRLNDDLLVLNRIAELAGRSDHVRVMPSGLNAAETKYVISQCRFFVGARTHSTIAALSSGVPTISVAYSMKAVGINRDIFGHARYVLDLGTLEKQGAATTMELLFHEESLIRRQLEHVIPEIRLRSIQGVELAAELIHD